MGSENFNIYSENLSGLGSPLQKKNSQFSITEDGSKLAKNQDSSGRESGNPKSAEAGQVFPEKKLVLSLNEAKEMCEKIIYTKQAKIVVLRRLAGPPTMTCFSDFMFLYLGNGKQLTDVRFQHVADSLTCLETSVEFNMSLIENRFNFLIYNSKIYKSLIFNMDLKPKIFHIGMKLVHYIKHCIETQSEGDEGHMINSFLHTTNHFDRNSVPAQDSDLEEPQSFMKSLYKISANTKYMDLDANWDDPEDSRLDHIA